MSLVDGSPLTGAPSSIPFLRLPRAAERFQRRADRLAALAPGHAAGDWLSALSEISRAQRRAAEGVAVSLGGRDLAPAQPLCAAQWRRDPAWRQALGAVLAEMQSAALPEPARAALARLRSAAPADLEALADALLGGSGAPPDAAAAPFLAAGLQVYFTSLAGRLAAEVVERTDRGCPVCGFPPVAATVGGDDKVRYLCCGLCASEWHLVRVHCATCRSPSGISYLGIEGDAGGVKAEVCRGCRTYLKVMYLEVAPGAEPLADDAATLALDLLLAEEGYSRGGVNLLVAPNMAA